jgi:hypothetical protein
MRKLLILGLIFILNACNDSKFLEEHEKEIRTNTISAFKTLINCEYFKTNEINYYLKYLSWVSNLSKKSIYFGTTRMKNVCAYASGSSSIFLNPDTVFTSGCQSLESTIGHETLHLAGLPPHNFKNKLKPTLIEIYTDKVYTISRECFQ